MISRSIKNIDGKQYVKIDLLEDEIKQKLFLQQENQELKGRIKTYEEPEDLTLMFMYCDEKAKNKIKELKEKINNIKKIKKDIRKLIEIIIKKHIEIDQEIEEIIEKYKEN